jgi:hypothetical protein
MASSMFGRATVMADPVCTRVTKPLTIVLAQLIEGERNKPT